MSTITGILNIKKAISTLNPEQVRQLSDRSVRVGVRAANPGGFARVEEFLLGGLEAQRRQSSSLLISRDHGFSAHEYDLVLYDESAAAAPGSLVLHPGREERVLKTALERHPELGVVLARAFPPFRRVFADELIARICRENTLFSLTTALPDVIPSFIELPWAVAEFASDTAFLTMNQLRMAFLLAAASDREVGYREQKSELAGVIASAFGWRAIARQIVGKIPFGGGLIGKAAVAYAGTKIVGLSLDHLYGAGYNYSRQERESMYSDALKQGRRVAGDILRHIRPDVAAKFAERAASRVPMVYPRGDKP
jgi:hypothetical protein